MSTIETRDEVDREEVDEYIDVLHDRIQFLEEELQDAERTILEMRQEGVETSIKAFMNSGSNSDPAEPGEDFETDVRHIARYIRYITSDFDSDKDELRAAYEELTDSLNGFINDGSDLNHASLAMWYLLLKYEELVRRDE